LTQSSWQRGQELLKTLICSLSGITNLTQIFLKKSTLKCKVEKLKALIDAVKCINNGEVEIPEDSEDLNESEKVSNGADEDVRPRLGLKIGFFVLEGFLAHIYI